MRSLLFLCLLASNFRGHAAISERLSPANHLEQLGISVEKSKQRHKPIRRFMAKKIVKALAISPGKAYGEGSAIAGLGCALVLIGSWFLSPFLGVYLTIPLLVAGFILSILGLVRAKQYAHNRRAKVIAIAGIILNSLLLLFLLSLLAWAFG